MTEFLIAYKPEILAFLQDSGFILIVPFVVLGFIYIAGRMFNAIKSDTGRNTLAVILMFTWNFHYRYANVFNSEFLFSLLTSFSISMLLYILFCWRLYDRIDDFLDRKLGDDKKHKTLKRKK